MCWPTEELAPVWAIQSPGLSSSYFVSSSCAVIGVTPSIANCMRSASSSTTTVLRLSATVFPDQVPCVYVGISTTRRPISSRSVSAELRRLTVPSQGNVFRLAGTYLIGIAPESVDLTHPFGRNPDRQDAVHPGSGGAKFLCEHLDHAGETRE